MLRNNFKIAWRHLLKSKLYSSINIIGLATGMAVAMLIGLWVRDELSFDSYHANHHRLAEIMGIETFNGQVTVEVNAAVPLGDELRSRYPGDFKNLALTATNVHVLEAGDKKITQWGTWAQPAFPAMFSLRMVEGDQGGLKDPGSILLSQWLAKSLFGTNDPMGKLVRVDNKTDMRVAGIYEDLPQNTTLFGTDFLLAWDNKDNRIKTGMPAGTGTAAALAKIESVFKKYDPGSPFEYQFTDEAYAWKFLTEEHIGLLASFFAILAIFISCLGLFGLASFVAEQRTREIGIRKVLGATVFNLWSLLSKEFVALVALSFLIAAPIAGFYLNRWLQGYEYRVSISWGVFAAAGAGALTITLLTVSFQAIKAALMNPVKSLKME